MKLFLIVLLFGFSYAADSEWDELIDQGIEAAADDLIDKHLDVINIPDIEETFNEKILGIPYTIDLKVKGAQFWNVTSLKRKSHVSVLQDDKTGNVTFSLALGLDDFHFKVTNLFVHIFGMTITGSLSTQCASNALDFSISLITDDEGNCKAYLNWARVTDFSKFTVQLAPSGFLNWLAEHTASLILNDFSSKIINFINLNLTDELNVVLSKVDICNYIPV
ncbi:hypothetical protein O3M35_009428 [Rhynocoris fuscipes]|uniref:Uncharacterized protein n=1 Tax=Rhynocoris fuscipes TaxID=488301 RepID=A0AAW1D8T7_9HEMI